MGKGAGSASLTRAQVQRDPNLAVVGDSVYDVGRFRKVHPGGEVFVSLFGGRDATEVFTTYHRRSFPVERMKEYRVAALNDSAPIAEDAQHLELGKIVGQLLGKSGGFAPWWYFVKVFVLLAGAIVTEAYQLLHGRSLFASVLQGYIFALIGLNVQHDANHGAVSRSGFINRFFGLSQDWLGGSSILWLQEHVVMHHPHCNNVEEDPDVNGAPLLRMNRKTERRGWHTLQHFYILPLELLYGLNPTLVQCADLFRMKFRTEHISPLAKSFWQTSVICKVVFLIRFFVIPLVLYPSWHTAGLLFVTTAVAGGYLSFFFALSHNYEGVEYLKEGSVGPKNPLAPTATFVERQARTSSNVGGAILGFMNGGLNYQIEHHLFPRIHHSHYPKIAPAVKAFCEKNNIRYTHFPTVFHNLRSMLVHLHALGNH